MWKCGLYSSSTGVSKFDILKTPFTQLKLFVCSHTGWYGGQECDLYTDPAHKEFYHLVLETRYVYQQLYSLVEVCNFPIMV